jgi:hypothetical protein
MHVAATPGAHRGIAVTGTRATLHARRDRAPRRLALAGAATLHLACVRSRPVPAGPPR